MLSECVFFELVTLVHNQFRLGILDTTNQRDLDPNLSHSLCETTIHTSNTAPDRDCPYDISSKMDPNRSEK